MTTSNLQKVVALVPAYNSGRFIERMLDSLAEQTYPNIEILISDDRSTDNTLTVCRRFAQGHPNVTVVSQEQNLGWVANSNFLLNAAEGDYFFFAFDDDELAPTYVERLAQALSANHAAVVAHSDMRYVKEDGRSEVLSSDLLSGVKRPFDRARIMLNNSDDWWIAFRGLYRATTCRELVGLKRNICGERGADWLWLLAMTLRGQWVRVPGALYTKYRREGSVGSKENWKRGIASRTVVFAMSICEVVIAPISSLEKVRLILSATAVRVPGFLNAVIGRSRGASA